MSRSSSTPATDAPASVARTFRHRKPLFVEVGAIDGATRYLVHAMACASPTCGKIHLAIQEATIAATGAFAAGEYVARGECAGDATTVVLEKEGERGTDDLVERLVERFVEKDFDRDVDEHFALVRAEVSPTVAPGYDFAEHLDGTMARFHDLFPDTFDLALVHEDSLYVIEDDWCVKPGCRCDDGILWLHEVLHDGELESNRQGAEVATTYASNVDGEGIPGHRPVPPAMHRAILARHEVSLIRRREQARSTVRLHWPRSIAATKIGRNDACPCGSGKKHKKCCLRAADAGS